jgi:hypothetical protein
VFLDFKFSIWDFGFQIFSSAAFVSKSAQFDVVLDAKFSQKVRSKTENIVSRAKVEAVADQLPVGEALQLQRRAMRC